MGEGSGSFLVVVCGYRGIRVHVIVRWYWLLHVAVNALFSLVFDFFSGRFRVVFISPDLCCYVVVSVGILCKNDGRVVFFF